MMIHEDLSELTIVRCSPAQARVTIDRVPPERPEDAASLYRRIDFAPDDFATWALVPRADPTTTDLLSHCDTYRRRAKVWPPSAPRAHDEVAYGISAVWTPPEHRNKGYARRMLQLLHYVLAAPDALPPFPPQWGSPPSVAGFRDARFSFLMSGIDGGFYSRCTQGAGDGALIGWVPRPPRTRLWKVPPASTDSSNVPNWQWLDAKAVAQLQPQYDAVLDELHSSVKTHFTVIPESALVTHAVPSTIAQGAFGLRVSESAWFTFFTLRPAPDMAMRIVLSAVHGHVPFAAVMAAARRAGAQVVEFGADYSAWDDHEPEVDTEWPKPCYAVYGGDPRQFEWVAHEALIVEGVGTPGRWAWY